MLDNYTLPAHYKQLLVEMEDLTVKIRDTLNTRTSSTTPLDNFSQVAMLAKGEQIAQFASCFNSFASKILSEFTASPLTVKSALEGLKYELFSCLSKYSELCSRGFPKGYEEGHELLIAVSKRLLEQILEVFENIVKFMNSLGQNQNMSGNNRISLYVKLNNDAEVARYVAWTERVQRQIVDPTMLLQKPNNDAAMYLNYLRNCKKYKIKPLPFKSSDASPGIPQDEVELHKLLASEGLKLPSNSQNAGLAGSLAFMGAGMIVNLIATALCALTKPSKN